MICVLVGGIYDPYTPLFFMKTDKVKVHLRIALGWLMLLPFLNYKLEFKRH